MYIQYILGYDRCWSCWCWVLLFILSCEYVIQNKYHHEFHLKTKLHVIIHKMVFIDLWFVKLYGRTTTPNTNTVNWVSAACFNKVATECNAQKLLFVTFHTWTCSWVTGVSWLGMTFHKQLWGEVHYFVKKTADWLTILNTRSKFSSKDSENPEKSCT